MGGRCSGPPVTSALLTYLYLLLMHWSKPNRQLFIAITLGHSELAIDKDRLHLEFFSPEQNLFLSIDLSV